MRLAKSTFRIADHDQMQKIAARDADVVNLATIADSEVLQFLETAVVRLCDQTSLAAKSLDEGKYLDLLRWLSDMPFTRHHELRCQSRVPGTGGWLFRHKDFEDWATSSTSSILLIHGIPGSGKSTLCSAIIDALIATASREPLAAPFAFVYCADSEAERERSSPDDILRSILRQLAINGRSNSPEVRASLLSSYEQHAAQAKVDGMPMPKLRASECLRLILDLAAEDPLTIVVDAVDEIKKDDRHTLLAALSQLVAGADNVIKVLLTSRDDAQIFELVPSARRIGITPQETRTDLEAFVHQYLDQAVAQKRLLNGNVSPELISKLHGALVPEAGEMFLWVKLKIDSLCRNKHEDDVVNAVSAGSQVDGVSKMYQDALDHILIAGQVAKDTAVSTFSWLLYMKETIRAEDLISAVCVEEPNHPKPKPSDLADICHNLVVFDTKCNVMRFAHHSVQEFLRTNDLLSPSNAHQIIASRCLSSSSLGPPADFETVMGCLYTYSAAYWAVHYGLVGRKTVDLSRQMESFVFDDDGEPSLSFEVWMESAQAIAQALPSAHVMKPALEATVNSEGSPLFAAAVFDLQGLLEKLSHQSIPTDWDAKNALGHTALYLACARGNRQAVKFLLQQGADADVECGSYGSALHVACFQGHTDIADLLLGIGATMKCGGKFSSPLQAAYRGGQEDVALLLLRDISTIKTQEEYDEAIQGAALAGFLRIINLLQSPQYTASFERHGKKGRAKARTAKAIRGGQLGVLRRFLEKDDDCASLLPSDAVAIAALYGHDDVMEFLIAKGMSVEQEGVVGSPLRTACLMNHERCSRLLLDHGVKVDTTGSFGSALQAASINGHARITNLLLHHGADVNYQSGLYGTALQAAAYHGHMEVVGLLLDNRADVNIEGFSRDAFHAAAEGAHYDVVQYFLERGYVSPRPLPERKYRKAGPNPYKYLLRDASPSRALDAESSKSRGTKEPVHQDSSSGRYLGHDLENILRLTQGATTSAQSTIPTGYNQQKAFRLKRKYCLEASAAAGHSEIVENLLKRRDFLEITTSEICDSLVAAAKNNHLETLQLLSEHLPFSELSANAIQKAAEASHSRNPTPTTSFLFDLAARFCAFDKLEALQTRLRKPTDVRERYGPSLDLSEDEVVSDFYEACENGDMVTISAIFSSQHRAQFTAVNSENHSRTGLELAASQGHTDVVRFFLGFLDHALISPTSFLFACGNGHLDVVRLLHPVMSRHQVVLDRGLVVACENAHHAVVQSLLETGANVNAVTELVHAPEFHRQEGSSERTMDPLPKISPLQVSLFGFERFRDQHVEWINGKNRREMHRRGHRQGGHWRREGDIQALERIVRLLLDYAADLTALGGWVETPLQVAVDIAPLSVVEWLVALEADVNAVGEGETPLRHAAGRETDGFAVVKLLVDAGGRLDEDRAEVLAAAAPFFHRGGSRYRDHRDGGEGAFFELTSVEDVLTQGPGALVEWLLRRHPDLGTGDNHLGLLLQMAAFLNNIALVELLVQRDVDVNSITGYYGTSLQAASRCGHIGVVKCLLEAGADVNVIHGEHHTAIRAAVLGAHNDVAKLLFEHGADPRLIHDRPRNWRKESHDTILQMAARGGCDAELIGLLLSHGLDAAEEVNNLVPCPLTQYSGAGSVAVVRLLIDSGVSPSLVEKKDHYTATDYASYASPLHAACYHGHADVIRLLLEAGADVHLWIEDVGTPLLVAAKCNQAEAIQVLVAGGAPVDLGDGIRTPLAAAAAAAGVEAVKELLKANAKVFSSAETGVPVAAVACSCDLHEGFSGKRTSDENDDNTSTDSEENNEGVKTHPGVEDDSRLQRMAPCRGCTGSAPTITYPGRVDSALNAACMASAADKSVVVEVLLEHLCQGSEAEAAIADAMKLVCEEGDEETFLLQLEYVPLDVRRLRFACVCGSVPAVNLLLDNGVDINAEDETNGTPLRAASAHLRIETVEVLLELGANPNPRADGLGGPLVASMEACATPWLRSLEYRGGRLLAEKLLSMPAPAKFESAACRIRPYTVIPGVPMCERIVEMLVRAGARVDCESPVYGPALHLAALLGSEEVVRLILDKGLPVNTKGGYFETGLFAAIEGIQTGVVRMLLKGGIDVQHNHRELGTALHHACRKESVECLRMLLDHGADPTILDSRGNSVLTTALKSEARTGRTCKRADDLLPTLLLLASRLPVQDIDVLIAAKSHNLNWVLPHLLGISKELVVPEEAIIAFLKSPWSNREYLPLLIQRNGGKGVTEDMLKSAAANTKVPLPDLLAFHPICPITPAIIKTYKDASNILTLLQHQPDLPITQDLAISIIRRTAKTDTNPNTPILPALWARNPELTVTPSIITHAAANLQYLAFLLARAPADLKIPCKALLKAVRPDRHAAEKAALLLNHDGNLEVDGEVILAAMSERRTQAENENETVGVLLQRAGDMEITEEIWRRGFGGVDGRSNQRIGEARRGFVDVLRGYGRGVPQWFAERMGDGGGEGSESEDSEWS